MSSPALRLRMTVAPGFDDLAHGFARRLKSLSGGRVALSLTTSATVTSSSVTSSSVSSSLATSMSQPEPEAGHLGTLHAAVDVHPGFAYFAGLPGALGMQEGAAQRWRDHDAKHLWLELQACAGVASLAVGATEGAAGLWSNHPIRSANDIVGRRLVCEGLACDVARGIGAIPASGAAASSTIIVQGLGLDCDAARHLPDRHRFVSGPAIARVASTVAIMIPASSWTKLLPDVREMLGVAASQQAASARQPPPRAGGVCTVVTGPLDQAFSATIDRVAEAVVADISGADRLTRRINASYFAAQPARPPETSQNTV